MDISALIALPGTILRRVWPRTQAGTKGSAASSAVLGELALLAPDEVLQRLGSAANGLTTGEAGVRLHSVGPNEVAHEARQTILVEIVTRSINPLNLLLLSLAAASYVLGDQRAALVIAIMVLLSISLGF